MLNVFHSVCTRNVIDNYATFSFHKKCQLMVPMSRVELSDCVLNQKPGHLDWYDIINLNML